MRWVLVISLLACGPLERAAAKDPRRCEHDPNCGHLERSRDCSTQCADNYECMRRCEMIQRPQR